MQLDTHDTKLIQQGRSLCAVFAFYCCSVMRTSDIVKRNRNSLHTGILLAFFLLNPGVDILIQESQIKLYDLVRLFLSKGITSKTLAATLDRTFHISLGRTRR